MMVVCIFVRAYVILNMQIGVVLMWSEISWNKEPGSFYSKKSYSVHGGCMQMRYFRKIFNFKSTHNKRIRSTPRVRYRWNEAMEKLQVCLSRSRCPELCRMTHSEPEENRATRVLRLLIRGCSAKIRKWPRRGSLIEDRPPGDKCSSLHHRNMDFSVFINLLPPVASYNTLTPIPYKNYFIFRAAALPRKVAPPAGLRTFRRDLTLMEDSCFTLFVISRKVHWLHVTPGLRKFS